MLVVHFSFISPYTCTHEHNSELQWRLFTEWSNYILHSFVEFSKNCAGFLWILRCVVLWTFLRVELMCFSLCNDSKTTKFGPSEFIQYIEGYLNKDKLKVWQFDFLINNYKYTSWTHNIRCVLVLIFRRTLDFLAIKRLENPKIS
jgi:hypothetical protein